MKTVVWLSSLKWNDLYTQRVHKLVQALSGDFKIIYVETKMTFAQKLLTLLTSPRQFMNGMSWSQGERIEIVRFYSLFPESIMNYFPFLFSLNGLFLKRALLRHLRISGVRHFMAGTSHPILFNSLISRIGADVTFYDCCDEHAEFKFAGPFASALERQLLRRVDIVFATSRVLQKHKAAVRGSEVHYLPNAVDFRCFEKSEGAYAPIKWGDMPVVGYVGHIAEWMDFELVEYLLKDNPATLFVFVGGVAWPIWSKVRSLQKKYQNIRLVPVQPYERVPLYIRSFDVAIIPFSRCPLVEAVDPIKLYEYSACGKPIVAVNWEEMQYYGHPMYLAATKEEFSHQISKAMEATISSTLIAFARQNTWDHRAEAMAKALVAKLPANSPLLTT